MEPEPEFVFVSFEGKFEPSPPGTPASPRPPHRPRETGNHPAAEQFVSPPELGADAAFARELADHVLAYVRNHPAGATAEQVAAMVQQLLARRSA